MTSAELSSRVESIVTKAEKVFGSQVNTTQQALFDQMQLLLNRLDLSPEGTIIQSQANRALLSKVNQYFDKAFNQSGYYGSLGGFVGDITAITAANDAYFTTILDTFSVDAQYLKSLQKQAVSSLQNLIANEGLEAQVRQPIIDILNQNVNTGASFKDLLKQIREFTLGTPELQGRLKSYSGQIVTDTLFNFSRSLQEAVSMKSGLQFVIYSGGLMDDSREFCVERAGNYYHKREVERWAKQDWQGKRKGTTQSTIFIYAGGYRCLHQIIYISEVTVPAEVIERSKELGYYK